MDSLFRTIHSTRTKALVETRIEHACLPTRWSERNPRRAPDTEHERGDDEPDAAEHLEPAHVELCGPGGEQPSRGRNEQHPETDVVASRDPVGYE